MTTRLLKEAILLAAELEGRDGRGKDELVGFLRRVANEDIRAFAMLLGRVLPLQVEARTDMSVEVTSKTVEEVRRELEDRGISIEAVKRTALVAIPDRFSRMIATNSHSSSTIRDRLLQCGFVTVERSGLFEADLTEAAAVVDVCRHVNLELHFRYSDEARGSKDQRAGEPLFLSDTPYKRGAAMWPYWLLPQSRIDFHHNSRFG
jgi:hypothetical protein